MKPITTRTWSTPLIMGSALVVGISGVMLFYHLQSGLVKGMHEWLGLLFVAAIVLHVLNHWMPVSRYLKNKQALAIITLVIITAAGWIITNGTTEEHPAKRLFAKAQQAPLSAIAGLQSEPVEEIVGRLQMAGITVVSEQQTLADIATKNSRNPMELFSIVLADKPQ